MAQTRNLKQNFKIFWNKWKYNLSIHDSHHHYGHSLAAVLHQSWLSSLWLSRVGSLRSQLPGRASLLHLGLLNHHCSQNAAHLGLESACVITGRKLVKDLLIASISTDSWCRNLTMEWATWSREWALCSSRDGRAVWTAPSHSVTEEMLHWRRCELRDALWLSFQF